MPCFSQSLLPAGGGAFQHDSKIPYSQRADYFPNNGRRLLIHVWLSAPSIFFPSRCTCADAHNNVLFIPLNWKCQQLSYATEGSPSFPGLFKAFSQLTHSEILQGLYFEPFGLGKDGETLSLYQHPLAQCLAHRHDFS